MSLDGIFNRIKGRNRFVATNIDGATNEVEVIKIFENKYRKLYNCVPNSRDKIQSVQLEMHSKLQMNCHDIYMISVEVIKSVDKLKSGKSDEDSIYSDHIINGTPKLFGLFTRMFNAMLVHGSCPLSMVNGTMIPIPKGRRVMMSSSDNYRAITVGSTNCKLFEYVILNKEGSKLGSNDLQFGFKKNVSTTQCAFALSEVISYYNFNRSNVYTVFLDATKAFEFDRVNIGKLFRILIDTNISMIVLRLLLNMYEKQKLQVKWGNHKSGMFDVNNGVKQGGVLSPVLFAVYIDELFDRLANCGHGCHADDIAIIAPSKKGIDVMIKVCKEFAVDRDMNLNGKKSTFMIFKGRHCVKARDNITIGGVNLQDVDETVYLGFKLQAGDSYNIILPDIAQFWRSVNIFFADFGHIYPALQCKLFVQYCFSLYGSPLWRLSGDECRKICVGWRKAMRRLWRISSMTHGVILALLAESPPMEIRMRECFHRFANGLFRSNNVSIIVQSIANVALCNPFSVFSNNCVTLKER